MRLFSIHFRLRAVNALLLALLTVCLRTDGAPRQPNFLIAVADDWSYGHAGAYGCSWVKTPAFDRVASHGVLFTRAYTPAAKCAPSRACMLTGRNPWQLKAGCNHFCFFPAEFKTFAEALGENGYFVGMTGKGWAPGIATNAAGQQRNMAGQEFQARKTRPPTTGIAPNNYAGNFEDFLQRAPEGRSWCFWYGAHEPHRPFEYGSGVGKAGKKLSDVHRIPAYWPDTEIVRNDLLDYAMEVEHFDRHLQRMLEILSANGELSNTVVIVTSDNGMSFPRVKSQSYQDSNRLPLAIMWPTGIPKSGRTVDDYVSFADFAPTILELAGIPWRRTGMAPMAGKSLIKILFSKRAGRVDPSRDHVLLGQERFDVGRPNDWGYPIRGMVKDDMLYLKNFEPSRWPAGDPETGYLSCDAGPTKSQILTAHRTDSSDRNWALCFGQHAAVELYDLKNDPDCLVNLAGRTETKPLQVSLEKQLVTELKGQNDPRMFGHGEVFERYPYSDAAYRNFYNRFIAGEKLVPRWVKESDFEKGESPSQIKP